MSQAIRKNYREQGREHFDFVTSFDLEEGSVRYQNAVENLYDDELESDRYDEHLDGVDVGAGCTEIWEHLSERRSSAD